MKKLTERIPLSKFSRFHTPGPWTVEKWHEGVIILDDGRETITEVKDEFSTTRGTAKANARLIAAAPAMEDALALLADLVGGMNVDPVEGTTTIGGQYATAVVSALEAARAALEAAAPAATADA